MIDWLLEIRNLGRNYRSGNLECAALRDVNLQIGHGEFIAVIGASGSGKSTLMNILGCLDRQTAGIYRVQGRDTRQLGAAALADLRRQYFGFIFQRYNLLPDLTALENVEIPSMYAGEASASRRRRATQIMTGLHLGDRLFHCPTQLSGGQQQRVSIARALMNDARVILADEPTGALDRQAGAEVLDLLEAVHKEGRTVILVTHDRAIAARARRVVELCDGRVVSDRKEPVRSEVREPESHERQASHSRVASIPFTRRLIEAARHACRSIQTRKLRSFLTMLGIVIGIASVVSVVAIGRGGQAKILSAIRGIAPNTLDIRPASSQVDPSESVQTLIPGDSDAIGRQPLVDSVTPSVSAAVLFRFEHQSVSGLVVGVGTDYFRVHGIALVAGRGFREAETRSIAQIAVIDTRAEAQLIGLKDDPIGRVILVGGVPFKVVGVALHRPDDIGESQDLSVWIPFTSLLNRVTGTTYLNDVTARIREGADVNLVQSEIDDLLTSRHRRKDFVIFNNDTIRKAVETTNQTLELLIGSIAVISLVVGGIGVMNIMLVSVTERTREVGIRMAIGARNTDILVDFLVEALIICLAGGAIGVGVAFAFGNVYSRVDSAVTLIFSLGSIVTAVAVSSIVGIGFGFVPAMHAARLDPVIALARE